MCKMTSELVFQMDNKDKMIREIDNKRIFGVIEIDIIKLEKEFSRLKKLNAVKIINKILNQKSKKKVEKYVHNF